MTRKIFCQFKSHERLVWANIDLKGKNKEHCLCWDCMNFKPGPPEGNCPIANLNFAMDILCGITTPVYECPNFWQKEDCDD